MNGIDRFAQNQQNTSIWAGKDSYDDKSLTEQNSNEMECPDPYEKFKKLKELLDADIITQEDFDKKKKRLLGLWRNILPCKKLYEPAHISLSVSFFVFQIRWGCSKIFLEMGTGPFLAAGTKKVGIFLKKSRFSEHFTGMRQNVGCNISILIYKCLYVV